MRFVHVCTVSDCLLVNTAMLDLRDAMRSLSLKETVKDSLDLNSLCNQIRMRLSYFDLLEETAYLQQFCFTARRNFILSCTWRLTAFQPCADNRCR